jgi:hypothetical protein
MLDDNSLFENGKRELVVDVINNGNGNYRIDKTLSFQNKVGIVVDVFDQMRSGGMKQTVTNLSLLIDGNPVYEIVHDTLDFRTMRSVNLEFDYNRAVDNKKTFRRLYHIDGNNYKGSSSLVESGGILNPATLTGKHTGEIIATDSYGNSSNLKFDFEVNKKIELSTNKGNTNIFNDSLFKYFELDYEIVDNGLLITAKGENRYSENSKLKLYHQENLLGILNPSTVLNSKAVFYISPQQEYSKIDRIELVVLQNDIEFSSYNEYVNIFAVGFEDNTFISFKDMNLYFNRNNFYQPRFIEIKKHNNNYDISPESFLCQNKFALKYKLEGTSDELKKYGIYWFKNKKDEWIWIDNKIANDTLYSFSEGGGQFAILKDTLAPTIRNSSIKHLKTYFTSMPKISFLLEDNLSWIEDDRNFLVTLDGEWLIPEYDFEQKLFQTKPNQPLKDGKHKLEIQITDRVGKKFEQTVEFYVKEKQAINKGN